MTPREFMDRWPPYSKAAVGWQRADLDAVIAAAVAEEREACAKVAEAESTRQEALYQSEHQYMFRHASDVIDDIADEIRARGK